MSLVTTVATILALAMPTTQQAESTAPSPQRGLEVSLDILDELDTITFAADYEDVRLDDVIADLTRKLPVAVLLDPESLRMIGVRGDDRVTLQSGPVPATAMLDALSRALASGLDQPTWDINDGAILLTSDIGLESLRSLGVYDVRDLIADDSLFAEIHAARPTPEVAAPKKTDGETEADAHVEKKTDEEAPTEAPATEEPAAELLPASKGHDLLLIILEHLDPDAWIDMGGSRATITDHEGLVVVTAPARLHRKFRDALRRLRSAQATSVRMVAQILDMPRVDFEMLSKRYPHEGQLAVAISRSELSVVRWQSQGTVAMGSTLALSSIGDDKAVQVDIKAEYDRTSGRIALAVKALMINGSDRREASTVVAFQLGEGAAILELAPAEPTDFVRMLIVRPM